MMVVTAAAIPLAAGLIWLQREPKPVVTFLLSEQDRPSIPDFAIGNPDGSSFSLKDYKGKVVIVNFWATWCKPCEVEIPWLMDFEKRYGNSGLAVLGIATNEEGWNIVSPYIKARAVSYRVGLSSAWAPTELLGLPNVLPTTLLLDKTGRLAGWRQGLMTQDRFEVAINTLLNQ